MLRQESDLNSWQLIHHHPFDGKFEDFFGSTSLHLSFTDFEMPLDVGVRGLRDKQAIMMETLVSANERGQHVGDLDILAMVNSSANRVTYLRTCRHSRTSDNSEPNSAMPESKTGDLDLVSLDCWDECFDPSHVDWCLSSSRQLAGKTCSRRREYSERQEDIDNVPEPPFQLLGRE